MSTWTVGTGPTNPAVFTPEPWWADELNLSTVAYGVSSASLGTAEPKGNHLELPQRDGYLFTPNRAYNPGEFSLSMFLVGTEPDGSMPGSRTLRRKLFDRNLHHLLSVVTNETRPVLWQKGQPGTTVRRQALGSVNTATDVETMMAMQRAVFTLVVSLQDSFWEDSQPTTVATPAGSSLPKTLDLTAAAGMSAPCKDAVVTVTGPITNPRVTNPETGVWAQMVGTLAAGKNLVIDSKQFTATVDGVPVSFRHGGHAAFVYIPTRQGMTSIPRLVLSGTGGGTGTKMSVTMRRKWKLP